MRDRSVGVVVLVVLLSGAAILLGWAVVAVGLGPAGLAVGTPIVAGLLAAYVYALRTGALR